MSADEMVRGDAMRRRAPARQDKASPARRWVLARAALGALVWLAIGNPAAAHALPVRANPPIDGTVAAAPAKLAVWFSQEVDPSQTKLTVIAPDGTQVDRGDTAVDLYDPHHAHVTVSLRPDLALGRYTVQWHSRSIVDSDAVDGSFTFTITVTGAVHAAAPDAAVNAAVAPTSAPLPPPMAASSAPPLPKQQAKPATKSTSSSDRTLVIVIIVAIVLVLTGRATRARRKLP